jgi:uncharacterized membrane protein YccC
MAGESVSFRITRSTEDLAQTVAALSQRLVKLEQRLGSLELQLDRIVAEPEADPEDLHRLDRVATLLADCRNLLGEDDADEHPMAA